MPYQRRSTAAQARNIEPCRQERNLRPTLPRSPPTPCATASTPAPSSATSNPARSATASTSGSASATSRSTHSLPGHPKARPTLARRHRLPPAQQPQPGPKVGSSASACPRPRTHSSLHSQSGTSPSCTVRLGGLVCLGVASLVSCAVCDSSGGWPPVGVPFRMICLGSRGGAGLAPARWLDQGACPPMSGV